jgi:PAS domain S-box-containing protein
MSRPSSILIVDDEPIGRETLEDLLISENYQLFFASDGPGAIAAVKENPPDLILLDVMMPGMDGFEVCKHLRANQSTAELPIVLVTALDDLDSRIRGIEAGADDFISKPYNRTELRARVKTITKLNRYRLLHIERLRFESLFTQSPDAILIVTYNEKVVEFNPVFAQLCKVNDNSTLTNKKFPSLFHEKDRALINHLLNQALQNNSKKLRCEADLITWPAGYLPVEVIFVNFPSKDQPSVQVIIHDLSEHVEARQKIQQQFSMLDSLFKSAENLVSNRDFNELSNEITNICVNNLEACTAWIGRLSSNLEWISIAKAGSDCARQMETVLKHNYVVQQLNSQKGSRPLIFNRYSNPELFQQDSQESTSLLIQALAFFPLIAKDTFLGTLALLSREEFFFTPERINVFKTFANQAAAALENARLFALNEKRLRHLQALRNVDVAITSSMDLETTYSVLLEQVMLQTGSSLTELLLLDQQSMTLRRILSLGEKFNRNQQSEVPISNTLSGQVILSRRTLIIQDLPSYAASHEIGNSIFTHDFRAYVGIPLISKGKIRGIFQTFYKKPLSDNEEYISLLEAFASQAAIAADNINTYNEIQQTNTNLVLALDAVLISWASSLELRDFEPQGHPQRLADLTLQLAKLMAVPKEELIHIWRGALLHDIGKISISEDIMLKKGKLTPEEWESIYQHTIIAEKLLSPINFLNPAKEIPIYHHERWDGSGYPKGLKGEEIPLSARIFMVVEVYDTLISDRPYRSGWSKENAISFISENAGVLFDPVVVERFLALIRKNQMHF